MTKSGDTLSCTIQPSGMRPIIYRKASHEGKHSGIDIVRYSYNGNTSLAECTRIRPGKANNVVRLQANGQAYDMLSIFFYIRALDYKAMVKNHIYTTTVFSGKKKETLRIRLVGTETIELRDKSKHVAYHVSFSFLTSSSCHPKIFVKEFSNFLMSCHQHCLGVNLLVQR